MFDPFECFLIKKNDRIPHHPADFFGARTTIIDDGSVLYYYEQGQQNNTETRPAYTTKGHQTHRHHGNRETTGENTPDRSTKTNTESIRNTTKGSLEQATIVRITPPPPQQQFTHDAPSETMEQETDPPPGI